MRPAHVARPTPTCAGRCKQLAKKDIRLAQKQKQLGHADISTTAKSYVLDGPRLGVTDDLF